MAGITTALPAPGCWALGKLPRETLEAVLAAASASGLRTAWLGPDAGFLSNLSLYENLELFFEWQQRPGTFADELQSAMTLLALDDADWLHERPSHQPGHILQHARLLRLVVLAPDIAIIEPVDAEALLGLPAAVFSSRLQHSRLLLRAAACPGWPDLTDHAMLFGITAETPAP